MSEEDYRALYESLKAEFEKYKGTFNAKLSGFFDLVG